MTPMVDRKRDTHGDGLADALLETQHRGEISKSDAGDHAVAVRPRPRGRRLHHSQPGWIFAELPDVYDDFRNEPTLRDAIVNEIALYDPPELSFYRVTTEDVTIRAVDIPVGSKAGSSWPLQTVDRHSG